MNTPQDKIRDKMFDVFMGYDTEYLVQWILDLLDDEELVELHECELMGK